MKFDNYTTFPHPVLGRADDIAGIVSAEISIDDESDTDQFVVSAQYTVENPDIERLISENRATFLCEIGCSPTLFRQVVKGSLYKQVFTFNKNLVRDQVDFLFLVVTTEPIIAYENSQVHSELAGIPTDLDAGDVLAYLGQTSFPTDIAFRKINAASSFLEIKQGDEATGAFKVILDNPKIQVRLSKEAYSNYVRPEIGKSTTLASTFHASIALPTLVYAIQQLTSSTGEFEEKAWARAIQWRLENDLAGKGLQLEAEAALELAQALLGSPIDRLLEDMSATIMRPSDEE